MIRSFRHRGIKRSIRPGDMDLPGWRFHALKGQLAEHFAVWVDENWRLTFMFEGTNAVLVDYQGYH
jgi:proteic killer suppression protein